MNYELKGIYVKYLPIFGI